MLSLSNIQLPKESPVILNNHSGNSEGDYSWRPQNQFKMSQAQRNDIAQQYLNTKDSLAKVAKLNSISDFAVRMYVKEFKAN